MMYVKSIIEEKIKKLADNRFNSVDEYIDCLTWTAHYGGVDQIYYFLKIIDIEYIKKTPEILQEPVYERLLSFVNKVDKGKYEDVKPFILNIENKKNVDAFLLFKKYTDDLFEREASHEEVFLLSFLLKNLLNHIVLEASQAEKIINYFWKAKNCNEFRKDYCIFLVVDHCIENQVDDLFKLKKQWYNHNQKILAKIYTTKILNRSEKTIYTKIVSENFNRINNLNSCHTPKIAVCISGLYRNHHSALESIQKNIVEPLNADVFIHSWDEMASWIGLGGTPHVRRLFGSEAVPLLPEEYHLNFHKIKESLIFTHCILSTPIYTQLDKTVFDCLSPKKIVLENQDEFIKKLGDDLDGYKKSRGNLNQIKMFHGIKQSIDLALDHDEYDYIIRLRPDLLIQSQLDIEAIQDLKPNTVYTGLGEYGVKDTEFTVSASVALSLSHLISKMFKEKKVSPYKDFPLYDAHNIFFAWILENKLDFEHDLVKKMTLLNMTDASVHLPHLEQSLEEDLSQLSEEEQKKFQPFADFLIKNYCE